MENPHGGIFDDPPPNMWYNLETKRTVKNKPRGLISLSHPRVVGKEETIREFLALNNLDERGERKFNLALPFLAGLRAVSHVQDKCSEAGSAFFSLTSDVENLPVDQLERICEFSLQGLRTKVRLLRILDGDTIDLAFFVPLNFLADRRYSLPTSSSQGLFLRMVTRLYGVDAAEHDTKKGIVASLFLEKIALRQDGIFWMRVEGFEKFGRLLAALYLDENEEIALSDLLVSYEDEEVGNVAVPYVGDAKSPLFTSLPRLGKEEASRFEEKVAQRILGTE